MESQPETPENNQSFFKNVGATGLLIFDVLKILFLALIIIVPIRLFIFQPFIVSGSSMEPNFTNGQYLVIDEISYRFDNPHRGDVVVLRPPILNTKEFYIKRVIGLPGEKVTIDNGRVSIINDGHPQGITLDETYLPTQGLTYPHDPSVVGGQKILILGPDEYFMMGDNRLASSDSRDWGILKRTGMVGKVFLRALPLNKFDFYTKAPAYSL